VYRPELPPPVAEAIRHLPPDVKRAVKQALRALSMDPETGIPLVRDLAGLWKYRVRRFRIVYAIDRSHRVIRIFAVGHRRDVYAAVARRTRPGRNEPGARKS
jgi:mRNA interferase RelE/StbE